MSGMCEERDCSACGVVSYVARRSDGGLCAECQLCRIDDEVVLDALSRAICAVIADAVEDERRQAAKATDERRLAEQVAWANVTNEVKPCPHGRPKGCSCSTCWPDAKPFVSREAEADSFRVKFNGENIECNALNRAHGWSGDGCVCEACVGMRVEARRQTEERAAAHLRHQEMLSPGSTTGRNAFISKNKPAMTSDEAHAAFMIRHGVATPLERQAACGQPQVCAKCSADLAYADPGQTLCYECRT